MRVLEDYQDEYSTFLRIRRLDGILEVRLHTDDGPVVYDEVLHRELPRAFRDIADDPANLIMILTGSGGEFIDRIKNYSQSESGLGFPWPRGPFGDGVLPTGWNQHDKTVWEGKHLLPSVLDIEIPIIAAINGPARRHADIALMSDVVLAADTAVFGDPSHLYDGIVPGDGAHIIWPLLLGPNRSRYFFYTNQEISAAEALELGLVGEVLPTDELLPRAWELARQLVTLPRLTLRYTRMLLTHPLRRLVQESYGFGHHLEGLSIAARASEERARARLAVAAEQS
jgi:enoyl-CoA hydratase/carnithine racemase